MTLDNLSKLIGNRIKTLREARNLKQVPFAKSINLSSSTLGNIENGRHPTKIVTLELIARALGTSGAKILADVTGDKPLDSLPPFDWQKLSKFDRAAILIILRLPESSKPKVIPFLEAFLAK